MKIELNKQLSTNLLIVASMLSLCSIALTTVLYVVNHLQLQVKLVFINKLLMSSTYFFPILICSDPKTSFQQYKVSPVCVCNTLGQE